MTKMFAGGFGQVTIKALHAWSHLFAPCPWDWMMAGTRFSSICRTSPGGPMEPITLRRFVFRLAHDENRDSERPELCSLSRSDWFLTLHFSQIHANCRIRRVYFSDRLYSEDELPAEFKLYLPVQNQKAKVKHKQLCIYLSLQLSYTTLFVFLSCSSRVLTTVSADLLWTLLH